MERMVKVSECRERVWTSGSAPTRRMCGLVTVLPHRKDSLIMQRSKGQLRGLKSPRKVHKHLFMQF